MVGRIGQNGWLKSQALNSEITSLSWAFQDHEPAGCSQVLFIVVVRGWGESGTSRLACAGIAGLLSVHVAASGGGGKFLEATQLKTQMPRLLEGQGKCLGSWGWSALQIAATAVSRAELNWREL